MLKKICGLFLGLVVLTGSACVTPTHASSAFDVVLVHIQASGASGAKEEMVSIYDNSSHEINITNWCLKNKSSVAFACFTTNAAMLSNHLPPYSFAVAATDSFLTTHMLQPEVATVVFTITNQSSGSLVNSNDSVTLVDQNGQTIDSKSWSTAIPTGKVLARTKSVSVPYLYETVDQSISWGNVSLLQIPVNQVEIWEDTIIEVPGDEPPTPDPVTDSPPSDTNNGSNAQIIHPIISELLPDADGSDTGNEFIELYNPSAVGITLSDYKLRVGQSLEKTYSFPEGAVVAGLSFSAFTNGQISFTLLNTTSSIQLEYKGQLIGNPITYASPLAGSSWALVGNEWQYTTLPTPGAENQASINTPATGDDADDTTAAPKPCAANQYRNPETNRCRLIATTSASTVTPCKVGQVRNPETNRCRNVASVSSPTPCKEGQERNPETNRCRNITKMTEADYGVKGVTTQAGGTAWYAWLAIAGVVVVILGYGVWEWREELKAAFAALGKKFARNKS